MADKTPTEVPLFPLDGAVLFPGTRQMFHIFEERYKLLVNDVLEGDRHLAIPLLRPGWEAHYFEAPAVHRVCGMGEIVWFERLEEGRFNLAVDGRSRIRLLEEVRQTPYRVARFEIIGDLRESGDAPLIAEEISRLRRLAAKLTELFPQFHREIAPLSREGASPSEVADLIAHRFVRDVYDKQSILNEPSVSRRLQLTRVQLMMLIQRFMREGDYREFVETLEPH